MTSDTSPVEAPASEVTEMTFDTTDTSPVEALLSEIAGMTPGTNPC